MTRRHMHLTVVGIHGQPAEDIRIRANVSDEWLPRRTAVDRTVDERLAMAERACRQGDIEDVRSLPIDGNRRKVAMARVPNVSYGIGVGHGRPRDVSRSFRRRRIRTGRPSYTVHRSHREPPRRRHVPPRRRVSPQTGPGRPFVAERHSVACVAEAVDGAFSNA